MKEQLINFETAKLAKEKGFDVYTKKVYVETLEYTLEMGRGGDCTFPYQAPRILNSGRFDTYDIVHCNAPTQELLKKWLREKHNIHMTVDLFPHTEKDRMYQVHGDYKNGEYWNWVDYDGNGTFSNYEDALEFGLQEGLKLIP